MNEISDIILSDDGACEWRKMSRVVRQAENVLLLICSTSDLHKESQTLSCVNLPSVYSAMNVAGEKRKKPGETSPIQKKRK